MTPTELALLHDLLAAHKAAVIDRINDSDEHTDERFDAVDDNVGEVKRHLATLNGRVRKVEQSNVRLKVVIGGLVFLALGWLKSALHF